MPPVQALPDLNVEDRGEDLIAVCFTAMASPCEVLLPAASHAEALEIGAAAAREAWRVERKYSRYRDDSVVAWIHANRGRKINVDAETAGLIDFAAHCHELSNGLFDITSGVLRRAWRFDGSERVPAPEEVSALLAHVGFHGSTGSAPTCGYRREWSSTSGDSARSMRWTARTIWWPRVADTPFS